MIGYVSSFIDIIINKWLCYRYFGFISPTHWNNEKKEFMKNLLAEQNWKQALVYLQAHKNYDQNDIFFRTSYYKIYNQLNDLKKAEQYLDEAIQINNKIPSILSAKGVFLLKQGNYLEALQYFHQASDLSPEVASYYVYTSRAHSKLNDYKMAIKYINKALKLSPENVSWNKILLNLLLKNNQKDDALIACKKLIELEDSYYYKSVYKDLTIQINKNTDESSQNYYDSVFEQSKKYKLPPEQTVYIDVWQEVIKLVKKEKCCSILDLGCGPGQFASYVAQKLPNVSYTGLDFSEKAIDIANNMHSQYKFIQQKLPCNNLDKITNFDVIIALEILEHINDDLQTLQNIPTNTFVVSSVPNFFSYGHVRYFSSAQEVEKRYGKFFSDLQIKAINLNSDSIIWLMYGYKN